MHMAINLPPSPNPPRDTHRTWPSRCGRYIVARRKGPRPGTRACRYYAVVRTQTGSKILSRHHTWRAAQRACERHAKLQWK